MFVWDDACVCVCVCPLSLFVVHISMYVPQHELLSKYSASEKKKTTLNVENFNYDSTFASLAQIILFSFFY